MTETILITKEDLFAYAASNVIAAMQQKEFVATMTRQEIMKLVEASYETLKHNFEKNTMEALTDGQQN